MADIHQDTAEILQIPRTRARVINYVLLYGQRADIEPRPQPTGVDCPDCRQSATGVYGGRWGCSRCGWSAGKFTRRLTRHF